MKLLRSLMGFLPHGLLLLVLSMEYQAAQEAHLDEEQLKTLLEEGTSRDKAWALHVLSNRGDPSDGFLQRTRIQNMIVDPDPLVADMTYMVDLCRLLAPSRQEKRLTSRFDDPEKAKDETEDWYRRYEFYRRKVGGRPLGGSLRLKKQEVQWLLHVLAGGELDEEKVIPYLERRRAGTSDALRGRLAPNKKNDRRSPRPSAGLVPDR